MYYSKCPGVAGKKAFYLHPDVPLARLARDSKGIIVLDTRLHGYVYLAVL